MTSCSTFNSIVLVCRKPIYIAEWPNVLLFDTAVLLVLPWESEGYGYAYQDASLPPSVTLHKRPISMPKV